MISRLKPKVKFDAKSKYDVKYMWLYEEFESLLLFQN